MKNKKEIIGEDSFWADLQQESNKLELINKVLLTMMQDLVKNQNNKSNQQFHIEK